MERTSKMQGYASDLHAFTHFTLSKSSRVSQVKRAMHLLRSQWHFSQMKKHEHEPRSRQSIGTLFNAP
jgi:hypothetical protein